MSTPPFTPADWFSALIRYITQSVSVRTGWDPNLSLTMIGLITERLRTIKWTLIRLAARIQAGRYVRRAVIPRKRGTGGWRPSPLPRHRGWLEGLLPETVPARGHLEQLLQVPEIRALIEAAPEAMGRPLRSLHWMLGLRPPAILKIGKAPPAAPPADPPRPPHPNSPPPPHPKRRAPPRPPPAPGVAPSHASRKPARAPPKTA